MIEKVSDTKKLKEEKEGKLRPRFRRERERG